MAKNIGVSPFFSRAYGGYTKKQIAFYEAAIPNPLGKRILDPMSGQAFALSSLAMKGADLTLIDVNPAPLLLAGLRDPEVIQDKCELLAWFRNVVEKVMKKRRKKPASLRVDDWLSHEIKLDINEFARQAEIGLFPQVLTDEFWNSKDHSTRFAVGMLVLAARRFVCYSSSDNLTWFKPGGMLRQVRLGPSLRRAADDWEEWANALELTHPGRIVIHSQSIESNGVPGRKKFDFIVTSPPYANRLDYTRLWAPETAVICQLCSLSVDRIRRTAVGTNCVHDTEHYESSVRKLPKSVRTALHEIADDPTKYSRSYYYPFFRNYAISLADSLRNAASYLRKNGQMIVFIRDTVRKNVLFPSGDLVKSVLTSKRVGLKLDDSVKTVIKQHIGNIRPVTTPSVYGMAQLEWWMRFRKA